MVKDMQQVLRKGFGEIIVDRVPDPELAPHQVLIRPLYSLISSGTETASIHQESMRWDVCGILELGPDPRLGPGRSGPLDGVGHMMRVLQLGAYPPPHGGVQTNIVSLRRYLRAHGVGCDVVNLTRHRREDRDGVYYPSGAFGVLRRLAGTYDILHLHIGGDSCPRLMRLALICTWMPANGRC